MVEERISFQMTSQQKLLMDVEAVVEKTGILATQIFEYQPVASTVHRSTPQARHQNLWWIVSNLKNVNLKLMRLKMRIEKCVEARPQTSLAVGSDDEE